jgi:hypothetical protein
MIKELIKSGRGQTAICIKQELKELKDNRLIF